MPSVRELRLYDRRRRPPEWLPHLGSGEYAAFFSDVTTDVPLDGEGEHFRSNDAITCLVFENLSEARRYALALVDRRTRVRVRIFDAAGCANPPALVVEHPSVAARRETSPRNVKLAIVASTVLVAGAGLLLRFDYQNHWVLIYPTIIALNLALAAARIVQWVFSARETQRARERAGEDRLKEEAQRARSGTR